MKPNIFNAIAMPMLGSNVFDLGNTAAGTMEMGRLVPTYVTDVVPGDKLTIKVENVLRFMPLIAPVMDTVRVTTHFWFVPNRILWPDWEKWIVGDSDVEAPYLTFSGADSYFSSLGDYLDYAVDIGNVPQQSALPLAAYLKIWNDNYRDQNLQEELNIALVPGNNTTQVLYSGGPTYRDYLQGAPLKRAWMHDYFTSALPFAQKGDAVTLPLTNSQTVPVTYTDADAPTLIRDSAGNVVTPGADDNLQVSTTGVFQMDTSNNPVSIDPNGNLEVDVNEEAVTINTLRRAFRLQEWLERNARGGTRYIENILAHFGVRSSDARLQRAEYGGGVRQLMVISEVLSTAQTDSDGGSVLTPVGQMAGHGISVGESGKFHFRVEEHGWVIGITNVQPVTTYFQGIPRSHSRTDRLDYYWPSFANIGEQEIKVKELWAQTNDPAILEKTFGYIPRYAEYKYKPNRVYGEMKNSLMYWTFARFFGGEPQLNEEFVSCTPRTDVFAVDDPQHIIYRIHNIVKAVRKMPKFGVPQI